MGVLIYWILKYVISYDFITRNYYNFIIKKQLKCKTIYIITILSII
jgi:hypothetical protein